MTHDSLVAGLVALQAIESALARSAATKPGAQVHAENADLLAEAVKYVRNAEGRVMAAVAACNRLNAQLTLERSLRGKMGGGV